VYPVALAKGKLGGHYRIGWEEKRKAGKSLIDEKNMIELPKRMPDAAEVPPR
jgi:ferredoxin-type protein NapG